MSNFDATEDSEVWHVRLPNGDVRVMTVDQLDAAFNAGTIHVDTMVLAEDATSWQRLGEVAGLDDEPQGESARATDDVAPPANPSSAVFYEQTTAVYAQQSGYQEPGYQEPAYEEPTYQQAAPRQAAYQQQAAMLPPPPAVPSFVLPPSSAPASFGNGLNSMRPVVSEISDFELEPVQFRSSKKKGVVVAIAALMVLGGAAFAVTKLGLPSDAGSASIAQASAPISAPAPSPIIPASVTNNQPAAKPAMDLSALSAPPRGLTEDQKKALADADKAREAKHKTKAHAASPARHTSHKMGPDPFHKGGDPHDPLNSAL